MRLQKSVFNPKKYVKIGMGRSYDNEMVTTTGMKK